MDLMTRQQVIDAEAAEALARQRRAAELTEQEMQVLKLFAVGATLAQLATVAKVKTEAGALKWVRRTLTKYAAVVDSTPISEARALMMARLDLIVAGNMAGAALGDEKQGRLALSAMQQQAKLLGLDAPKKFEHEHHLNDTPAGRQAREQNAIRTLTQFNDRIIEGETAA